MIIRRIEGATHNLGAPKGWDPERDGPCYHLPIRAIGDAKYGHGFCESAWEPTPAELALLNQGASLTLRVHGWQQPVALYVEPYKTDQRGIPVEPVVSGQPDQSVPGRFNETKIMRAMMRDLLGLLAGFSASAGWNSLTTPDCIVAAELFLMREPK